MKTLFILSVICVSWAFAQNHTSTVPDTTSSPPCWADMFPTLPPNATARGANDLTCDVCSQIFQGLDDVLIENEEQIAHALENLCEGMPWLFEICWRVVESC